MSFLDDVHKDERGAALRRYKEVFKAYPRNGRVQDEQQAG
jgi:hypothetical protein